MKKNSLLCLLLICSFTSFSQELKPQPSLQVSGHGRLSVHPDQGVLSIQVKNISLNFSESIVKLNKKSQDISSQINAIGFSKNAIKTTDFQINNYTVYRKGENIDSGYIATQNVEVVFKNTKENITKIINTFSKSKTDFGLNFSFKLSDSLKAVTQKEIIRLSVADASEKAKILAESASIKLKRIREISYGGSFGNEGMNDRPGVRMMAESSAIRADDPLVGFSPKDLILTDNVNMIWDIE